MKTAKEHWSDVANPHGAYAWQRLDADTRRIIEAVVVRVRNDARADALAEGKGDADVWRQPEKRYGRWRDIHPHGERFKKWKDLSIEDRDTWRLFLNELNIPPEPMRTPGQVLADALYESGFAAGLATLTWQFLRNEQREELEAAATALSIQPAP